MNKLRYSWNNLHGTFWFLPSLIIALSVLLAVVLIETDSEGAKPWMAYWPRLFGAGAAGARGMLSTIAGSMMTVVGVTFSMTLVALTLASNQYTSRIMRNFMRDRVTQVGLGIFAGIYTYCLIILRTIRGSDQGDFIPSLAVSFGVILAIGGISILIFFIHHIASSIQAANIIASVAAETLAAVDRLFPGQLGQGPSNDEDEQAPRSLQATNWQAIPVPRDGYIQSVDNMLLLRLSRQYKTVVRMERGIGGFVVKDTPLVSVALTAAPDKTLIAKLQSAYVIDRHRTVEQDSTFGIRQIVDMALRALSPGINDTTTAVMCVDYLTAILARVASRAIPSRHRYEGGELRIIAIGPTFASLLAESFDQIRGSANGNVAVMVRMMDAVETIGTLTTSPDRQQLLREEVQRLAELAERTLKSPYDKAQAESRLGQVRVALKIEPVFLPAQANPDRHNHNRDRRGL